MIFCKNKDNSGQLTDADRIKESNSDLRAYLSQIVEALRWTKLNQNRTSALVISLQVALLSGQAKVIFPDTVRLGISLGLCLILIILLLVIYPRTQRQLRLREATVFEHLSPEARAVLVFYKDPQYKQKANWEENLRTGMREKRNSADTYMKSVDAMFMSVPLIAVVFLTGFHIWIYYEQNYVSWFP